MSGAGGPHEGGSCIGRRSGGALAPRNAEGAAEGPQTAARRVAAAACRPAWQAHLRVQACTECLMVSACACQARNITTCIRQPCRLKDHSSQQVCGACSAPSGCNGCLCDTKVQMRAVAAAQLRQGQGNANASGSCRKFAACLLMQA